MHTDHPHCFTRRRWLKTVLVGICGGTIAPAHGTQPLRTAVPAASTAKVSRISAGKAVACTQCDACMPCGYGVDIPANFKFYDEMLKADAIPDLSSTDRSSSEFRSKAIGFLRKYDRTIPDRHQSQRCIKCFHCVMECREKIFIVNELASLTAITDELRDWECQHL